MEPNQTIRNNQTGETLTLLISEQYNRGASNKYEVAIPAHRPGPPAHFHTGFKEIFTVKKGVLDFYMSKDQVHVAVPAGQSITAHAWQVHRFANDHDQPAIFTVEAIPAGGLVRAFQVAYGIANEGKAGKDGLPASMLERLYFIRLSEGYKPHVPVILQQAVIELATLMLTVKGRKRQLDEYLV